MIELAIIFVVAAHAVGSLLEKLVHRWTRRPVFVTDMQPEWILWSDATRKMTHFGSQLDDRFSCEVRRNFWL